MTAWPVVKNALIELVPTLTGWSVVSVFNGPVVTGSTPMSWFTVGHVVGEDFGGSFEQDRGLGDVPQEAGTIRSELVCWDGAASQMSAVQDRAFALYDALQAEVDRDPTLGIPNVTASLSVDVQPAQTQAGAEAHLAVTLSYIALGI